MWLFFSLNLFFLYIHLRFFFYTILKQSISFSILIEASQKSNGSIEKNDMETRLDRMADWGVIELNKNTIKITHKYRKMYYFIRLVQIIFHGKSSKIENILNQITRVN